MYDFGVTNLAVTLVSYSWVESQNLIRCASGTPLLVCLDLLGSVTGVRALDGALCEGANCEDDGILGRNKERSACIEANDIVIGCLYGDGVRLIVRDSCGIAMREGTSDRGVGSKASSKGLMD